MEELHMRGYFDIHLIKNQQGEIQKLSVMKLNPPQVNPPQSSHNFQEPPSVSHLFHDNFHGNFNRNQSTVNLNGPYGNHQHVNGHTLHQQSNGDISNDMQGTSSLSDTDTCGKKTIWNKIRGFFENFKRNKSSHQRHNHHNLSYGSLRLDDLKVHSLKNFKVTKIKSFTNSILKAEIYLPNIIITSNYEMNNWGKQSHKLTANGRLEVTLEYVKVEMTVPVIEEIRENQKLLKALRPQIDLKFSK